MWTAIISTIVGLWLAIKGLFTVAKDFTIEYVGGWIKHMLDEGVSWLFSLLDEWGVLDSIGFSGASDAMDAWNSLIDWVEPAAWFLPIYPAMAIVSVTFALQGIIRGLRWIFALIPTLGG